MLLDQWTSRCRDFFPLWRGARRAGWPRHTKICLWDIQGLELVLRTPGWLPSIHILLDICTHTQSKKKMVLTDPHGDEPTAGSQSKSKTYVFISTPMFLWACVDTPLYEGWWCVCAAFVVDVWVSKRMWRKGLSIKYDLFGFSSSKDTEITYIHHGPFMMNLMPVI